MKSADVVVDSSLFYALVDRRDDYHDRATAFIESRRYGLRTTLPVVTEVVYLLRASPDAQIRFLKWLQAGGVLVEHLDDADSARVIEIMERYADLPADYADAALIAVAERLGTNRVATFDRDFDVYRYRDRAQFRNVLR